MVAYSPFKSFSYIQCSKDADDRTMLGGLKNNINQQKLMKLVPCKEHRLSWRVIYILLSGLKLF